MCASPWLDFCFLFVFVLFCFNFGFQLKLPYNLIPVILIKQIILSLNVTECSTYSIKNIGAKTPIISLGGVDCGTVSVHSVLFNKNFMPNMDNYIFTTYTRHLLGLSSILCTSVY